MSVNIKEVKVKSILTKTGIPGIDYCINPYVGCSHGCRYCYATFMKRFTVHTEAWGSFVDSVIIDRMNYTSKTLQIYRNMNLTKWLDRGFTDKIIGRLKDGFGNLNETD